MSVYRPTYKDQKTGETKQAKIWWFEFSYSGHRIRESSGTTRKTLAQKAEKRRHLELERANAGLPSVAPEERIRRVSDALKEYSAGYSVNHRKTSITMVKNRSAHLVRLLGSAMLSDLTAPRIIEYMQKRVAETDVDGDRVAGGRTVNLEVQILACAIGHTWKALWPRVKKLEENHDVGRALETTEEQSIMDAALKNQSRLIYPFLYTLAWTGMRSDEARTLRWSQVNFERAEIVVNKSKTDAGRGRRIPMSVNLAAVLGQHAAWCVSKVGALQPEWYVFPLSNRLALKDPTKPVTSLKTAWETVRTTANVKCRLHDLRHSFCTKLAEAGVPESTMLDIMGHVSAAMLRRYSHIRAQARRDAIDAVELRQFPIGVPKDFPKVDDSAKANTAVTD